VVGRLLLQRIRHPVAGWGQSWSRPGTERAAGVLLEMTLDYSSTRRGWRADWSCVWRDHASLVQRSVRASGGGSV